MVASSNRKGIFFSQSNRSNEMTSYSCVKRQERCSNVCYLDVASFDVHANPKQPWYVPAMHIYHLSKSCPHSPTLELLGFLQENGNPHNDQQNGSSKHTHRVYLIFSRLD